MGFGHRNMYYLTGQPGWMRFGYSPGWAGRCRGGLRPYAKYILTGRWPATAALIIPPRSKRGLWARWSY